MFGRIISLILSALMVFSSLPVTNNGAEAFSGGIKRLVGAVVDLFDGDDKKSEPVKEEKTLETQADENSVPNKKVTFDIQDYHLFRGNDGYEDSSLVANQAKLIISGFHAFDGNDSDTYNIHSCDYCCKEDRVISVSGSVEKAMVPEELKNSYESRLRHYDKYVNDTSFMKGIFYYDTNTNNTEKEVELGENDVTGLKISVERKTTSGYRPYTSGPYEIRSAYAWFIADDFENKFMGDNGGFEFSIVDFMNPAPTGSQEVPAMTENYVNPKVEKVKFWTSSAVPTETYCVYPGEAKVYSKDKFKEITYVAQFHTDASHYIWYLDGSLYSQIRFSIKYVPVDTTALWNLYKAEYDFNKKASKRESLAYTTGSWGTYQNALETAENRLKGGVSQDAIDLAYNNLLQAIRNLKINVEFHYNDKDDEVVPKRKEFDVYSKVEPGTDGSVTYTFNTLSKNTIDKWPDVSEFIAGGKNYIRKGKYYTTKGEKWLVSVGEISRSIDKDVGYKLDDYTLEQLADDRDHVLKVGLEWDKSDILYRVKFEINKPEDAFEYYSPHDYPSFIESWVSESYWYGDGSKPVNFLQIPEYYHIRDILNNDYKLLHWSTSEDCGTDGEELFDVEPEEPYKYNNLFAGNDDDIDFLKITEADNGETICVISKTLYAHWALNYFRVTYNINAPGIPGSGASYTDIKHGGVNLDKMTWTEYHDFDVYVHDHDDPNDDTPLELDNNYELEGYIFKGWYKDGEEITEYTPKEIGEDVVFIAEWQKECYKFEFDFNGAEDTDNTLSILRNKWASSSDFDIEQDENGKYYFYADYGDYIAPVPTPGTGLLADNNKTFDGWEYGTGSYSEGTYQPIDLIDSAKGLIVGDYGDDQTTVTILAIWKISITIHYNIDSDNENDIVELIGNEGDLLTEAELGKFNVAAEDITKMNNDGFSLPEYPWYRKTDGDSDNPYKNLTDILTNYPEENWDVYCGWKMDHLSDAVSELKIQGNVSSFDSEQLLFTMVVFCDEGEDGLVFAETKNYFTEDRRDGINSRYFLSDISVSALNEAYAMAMDCFTPFDSLKFIMLDCVKKGAIKRAAEKIDAAVEKITYNPADYTKINAWKDIFESVKAGTIDCLCRDDEGNESDLVWESGKYQFEGGAILELRDEQGNLIKRSKAGEYSFDSFKIEKWDAVENVKNSINTNGSRLYYDQGYLDKLCYEMKKAINNLEFAEKYSKGDIRKEIEYFFGTFADYSFDEIPQNPDDYEFKKVTAGSTSEIGKPLFDENLIDEVKDYFTDAYNIYWDSKFDPPSEQIQEIVFMLHEMNMDVEKSERAGDYSEVNRLWDMYLGKIPYDSNGNYLDTTKLQLPYRSEFVTKYSEIMSNSLKASKNDVIKSDFYELQRRFNNMIANPEQFTFTIVDTQLASQSITYSGSYGDDLTGYSSYIPLRNGYSFAGFYEDEALTKPYCFGLLLKDTTVYPKWTPSTAKYKLSVDISGNGSVKFCDETPTTNKINKVLNNGDIVTLTATASKSARFIGWQDAKSKKIVSENEVYSFNVVSDVNLTALFVRSDDNVKIVIFKDFNGVVLSVQGIKIGSSATAPDMSASHISGYTFEKWDRDFTEITDDMTVNAVYKKNEVSYNIEIIGGIVINGINPTNVKYNDYVLIKADKNAVPDGKVFAGWSFDNGKTFASLGEEFGFCVIGDMTVTAIYTDAVVEKTPTVVVNEIVGQDNKLSFVSTRSVDDSYRVIESGMLMTVNGEYANLLTLENASVYSEIKLGKTATPTNDGQYRVTVTATKGRTYYAVAYVVYIDNSGNIRTVYSDRAEMTY